MVYQVSAGAILYAMRKGGHRQIYGVTNVLANKNAGERKAYFQQVEMELLNEGLGIMDLDGGVSLDPDFAAVLSECCNCGKVLSAALRRGGVTQTITVFVGEEKTHVLVQTDVATYQLHTDTDATEQLLQVLNLPGQTGILEETTVDSGLILYRDAKGMVNDGCSEELAQLIVNACKGIDGYAQISTIVSDVQTDLVTLVYNHDGIVSVDVEYTWGQELFRLTPVSAQWVADKIHAMQK